MNIIFVCKWNRFRSKIAEAFFKKYNKNKDITCFSRGIHCWPPLGPIGKLIGKKIGNEFELVPNYKQRKITKEEIKNADLIINVTDNLPEDIFRKKLGYNGKLISWKIADVHVPDLKRIRKTFSLIEKEVKKLLESPEIQ